MAEDKLPDDEELKKRIEKHGLDSEYWMKIFAEQLDIRSASALKYLRENQLTKLMSFAAESWQKRALKEMVKDARASAGERKLGNQATMQALADAKALMPDNRSSKLDEKVTEAKNKLSSENAFSLDGMTEQKLSDQLQSIQQKLESREISSSSNARQLSCAELLSCASDGLCLHGILKSKNVRDLMVAREKVLRPVNDITLANSQKSDETYSETFTSHHAEEMFESAVTQAGHSMSLAAKGELFGIGIESRYSRSDSRESETAHKRRTCLSYAASVKYAFVPIQSCFIEQRMMRLSQEAMDALLNIETMILSSVPETQIQKSCTDFLKRFGSHATQGPLVFGGIYWWKSIAEGFQAVETSTVKQLVEEVNDFYIGACYSGIFGGCQVNAASLDGSFRRNYKENLVSKVRVSISKTGGSPDVDSLQEWKRSLVLNNSTWKVIDRGMQVVPVWEILLMNHMTSFQEGIELARRLVSSYGCLTHEIVDLSFEKCAAAAIGSALEKMSNVADFGLVDLKNVLSKLLDIQLLLRSETQTRHSWPKWCLSNQTLQTFFKCLAQHMIGSENVSDDSSLISSYASMLLIPDVYDIDDFVGRDDILRWLHKSEIEKQTTSETGPSELSQLLDIFRQLSSELCELKDSTADKANTRESKIRVTSKASRIVYQFGETLKQKAMQEELYLLFSVAGAVGYNEQHRSFVRLLSDVDMRFMVEKMSHAYHQFPQLKEESRMKAQANLLRFSYECIGHVNENWVTMTETYLAEKLELGIKQILQAAKQSNTGYGELDDQLRFIVDGASAEQVQPLSSDVVEDLNRALSIQNSESSPPVCTRQHLLDKNTEFKRLLECLDLEEYFVRRMHLTDVLVIDIKSLYSQQIYTENELIRKYLQRLIMFDYNARYLKIDTDDQTEQTGHFDSSTITLDDLLSDDGPEDNVCERSPEAATLHPMDIQMAVIHCADLIVKRYLFSRLAACQYAVPLVVPTPYSDDIEFNLWACRDIKVFQKDSDHVGIGSDALMMQAAEKARAPIVNFMRLGYSSYSKSSLINHVLNGNKHHTFYNRHSLNSSKNCTLMEGVIETHWYSPCGRGKDTFDDLVAFSNLHGDASDKRYSKQVKFLNRVSTMNVVLLPSRDALTTDMQTIVKSIMHKPLVLLVVGKPKPYKEKQYITIPLLDKTDSQLVEEITSGIKDMLSVVNQPLLSLEDISGFADDYGFLVDEEQPDCKLCKSQARELQQKMEPCDISEIKNKLLPLQGKLWRDWCALDRSLNNPKDKENEGIERYRDKVEREKKRIRLEQLSKGFPLNEFVKHFISQLANSTETNKILFVQWMRQLFDEKIAKSLLKLHRNYYKQQAACSLADANARKDKLEKMVHIANEMNCAALGIEHVLREIGQIFEAGESHLVVGEEKFAHLAHLAAQLLLQGYPLELMDGDAAYVPVKWISEVLRKLQAELGNKKVFVVSVLGLQSSGKSTLLNALFGLQFAVSAGRCTKGAFMQLLKLFDNNKSYLDFEYLIVIDTEGLRPPHLTELSMPNHDNELATFAIGLADLTIINIFGENSVNIEDILQISVQAFLRMKQVHLRPSCLFVHQNVAAINANDATLSDKTALQHKLDKMTELAAKQEQCTGVTRFSDVIEFDFSTQTLYFTNLWEGKPPMAPISSSYTEDVQKLKQLIFSRAVHQPIRTRLSLSSFTDRIADLWQALRCENFVFSFRNSVEIDEHNKLEVQLDKWTWSLRSSALDCETDVKNRIKTDWNTALEETISDDIRRIVQDGYEAILPKIKDYFDENDTKHIRIHWKANVKHRFEDLKEYLIRNSQKSCRDLLMMKRSRRELDEKCTDYENKLMVRSRQLATELKNMASNDDHIENAFQDWWAKVVAEVTNDLPLSEESNIASEVESVLTDQFQRHGYPHVAEAVRKYTYTSDVFRADTKHHVQLIKWRHKGGELIGFDYKSEYNSQIDDKSAYIEGQIHEYLSTKEDECADYSPLYVSEIIRKIEDEVAKFNHENEELRTFKLKRQFILDLSVYLCMSSIQRFKNLRHKFTETHSPLRYLLHKRNTYLTTFKMYCKGDSSIAILVELIAEDLQSSLCNTVLTKTCIGIADTMKTEVSAFNQNRIHLEYHILKYLAQGENFDAFYRYIRNPQAFIQEYIENELSKFCKETTRLRHLAQVRLTRIIKTLLAAVDLSSQVTKNKSGDVNCWFDEFQQRSKNIVFLRKSNASVIEQDDSDAGTVGAERSILNESMPKHRVSDISFLHDSMIKTITKLNEILELELKQLSFKDLSTIDVHPGKILFDQFQGCWKQCPECKAICTNTVPEHDKHFAPFHLPHAVNGTSWIHTKYFAVESCTACVASKSGFIITFYDGQLKQIPWSRYTDAGPEYAEWSIKPDSSEQIYWKWFVNHFRTQLEEKYKLTFDGPGVIPPGWETITKEDAIASIDKLISGGH